MRLCLSATVLLFLVSGTLTQELSLFDAIDDPTPAPKPKEIPKAPEKPKAGGDLDLLDAFGPDEVTTKAPKKPSPGGSGSDGGTFDDKDLFEIGGGGDYKPDGGRSGGRAVDPGNDPQGDQPQDPDLQWGQILKMLNANIPEEFYMWMSNFKQTITSLLERAMELLQAAQ